tara:strand:- start:5356 stop:6456 length:1101 start_codon:yes stop_codon:yes gene_type:complete
MAINFPDTTGQPTNGSYTYTVAGITYAWDGSSWEAAGAGASATDRSLFSVTTNSANATPALSYNNNTGVFTYTPPLPESDTLQSVVDRGSTVTTDIQTRGKLDCRPTSGGVANSIYIDPNSGDGELKLYNDVKALFGFGDDLQIYHSDPDNYIKSIQGTLKIRGNAITLENEDGNEQYIECVDNGSVKLYHDFIPRLETSSTGVTISGALTAGGLTYPTTNGTSGDVLTSDGSGNVTWSAPTGLQSRTTAQVTQSITNNAVSNVSISTPKTYALMKIQTSHAAWVTLYTSTTARTNDSGRLETTDPTPGSGVLSEVITTGSVTQLITPATVCFNESGTGTTYAKIVNKSGATANVTVTLTYVQLEA